MLLLLKKDTAFSVSFLFSFPLIMSILEDNSKPKGFLEANILNQ